MSSIKNLVDSLPTLKFNRIEALQKTTLTKVQKIETLQKFRVMWKDLTYTARLKPFSNKTKIILNSVNGLFDSGQITGIMGPSGCGKSTLLGCIAGLKKTGLTGSITISTNVQVKFAYIVQDNYILQQLTVRESLIFASKLKNGTNADHINIVNDVVNRLMLQTCADNFPKRCSGGQLKRVMIGLEMVSKPNILILDEPTSGLDSVTTWQLINTLIKLTYDTDQVAVVVTIHQPSAKLFSLFNRIILMSGEGQCIFNGPPVSMTRLFGEIGLLCPKFTNISDFGLEVASGDYGRAKLLTLSTIQKIEALEWPNEGQPINFDKKYKTAQHIWLLTKRSVICMIRNPYDIRLRIIFYLVTGVLISLIYGPDVGHIDGCPHDFTIGDGRNLFEKFTEIGRKIIDNVSLIGFLAHFAWFIGIFPVLLVFPTELNVFLQEFGNGYYSAFSYFLSKVLSDTLFNLFLPNLGSAIIFFMTGQYWENYWRVLRFMFNFILITINSSCLGFLIGSFLANYPSAIAFVGMLSLVPLILLSGVMIPIQQMPRSFQWLSFLDYMRFGFLSELITINGFERCLQTYKEVNETDLTSLIPADKMIEVLSSDKLDVELVLGTVDQLMGMAKMEGEESFVMQTFGVTDNDYYFSIYLLILHIIVYRALTYLFILRKTKP